jgi:lipopolysaccharide biosynthesis regulator YciM
MPTESTFLLAGLFLLLAAAGWAMGRFGERDEEAAPPPLNIDYLKGLNFLLNEQTDQALEHFLAIRIHQNIIARPDLAAEQRDQALFSLAKDYLHAGLLDRAEKLFVRLSQGSRYQVQALENLCRIYEQEKEWERAIEAAEKLEVRIITANWPKLPLPETIIRRHELMLKKRRQDGRAQCGVH